MQGVGVALSELFKCVQRPCASGSGGKEETTCVKSTSHDLVMLSCTYSQGEINRSAYHVKQNKYKFSMFYVLLVTAETE